MGNSFNSVVRAGSYDRTPSRALGPGACYGESFVAILITLFMVNGGCSFRSYNSLCNPSFPGRAKSHIICSEIHIYFGSFCTQVPNKANAVCSDIELSGRSQCVSAAKQKLKTRSVGDLRLGRAIARGGKDERGEPVNNARL
ncbi:hypothetical protein EVAR_5083_1 [Eumeta japonica]|uniref:Uncharacterized protein n=1 Tax=Eumeta variegata TaxID=151549 RepID=A0A4C1SUB0_EUMVA|nr:hypothetical protein EVAR_5083_1 [Eumeta japonica]